MRARAIGLDIATLAGSGPNGRIVEEDVLAATPSDSRILITPVARRLAQEHGVAIGDLVGTGPGGRITQEDVLRVADHRAPAPAVEPAHVGIAALSRVRKITAERMAASAQATARVTLFLEADFSEAARFRTQLQPEFARLGTPKLPWDALIAKAAALALADHAAVAAQWVDGQGLRPSETAHVGIGVAVTLEPEGLVVPVLKDAGSRSLRELATDLLGLVDKARSGRLSPLEMSGGAFTITNLGAYRVDGFTPIINPPETAILGVGRIIDKAVVVDGKIEPRTMCTLSLSFDHRVVDGAPAAAFLARLAELLERPYALLGI
jgi:pyruvate dehydrogenase E2 component (dihydrolipoamide acetyltransferase)